VGQRRLKSCEVTENDNHEDTASYVSVRVQELQEKFGLDDSRRDGIARDICSRAGGKGRPSLISAGFRASGR
jgi:hypothetical protein